MPLSAASFVRERDHRHAPRLAVAAHGEQRALAARTRLPQGLGRPPPLEPPGVAPRNASVTWRFSGETRRSFSPGGASSAVCHATRPSTAAEGRSRAQKSRSRSSPSTLAPVLRRSSRRERDNSRRSVCRASAVARARTVSRSPGSSQARRVGSPGPVHGEKDEADGLLRRSSARPRDARVRDCEVGPERRRGRPAAMAAPTSAETAPCSRRSVTGDAELLLLHLVGVGDHAAEEDVARARPPRSAARRSARPCTTPPWRGVSPASRHRSRTISSTGRSSSRAKRSVGERVDQSIRQPYRDRLAARPHDEIDVDLEIARADGRLEALRLSPGLVEDARDGGLRGPEEAQRAARPARPPVRTSACTAGCATAFGQSRRSSAGGPGSAIASRPPSCSSRIAGAVPASPSETPPSGSEACLRIPGRKSPNGRFEALCDTAGERFDLGIELLVERRAHVRWPPPGARQSGRRASGPRPPETTQRSAWRPSASAAASSSGRSPTTTTRSGSRPRRVSSVREERAVQVAAVAADELAAGDDDDGPRRSQLRGRDDCKPFGLDDGDRRARRACCGSARRSRVPFR